MERYVTPSVVAWSSPTIVAPHVAPVRRCQHQVAHLNTVSIQPNSRSNRRSFSSVPSVVARRRERPGSNLTVFRMSQGGRGGGRGPFGLRPGTLATLGFGLLFVFAPGLVMGAFNTLFLMVTLGPLLLSLGVNVYQKLNLIESPCPVCGTSLQGAKNGRNQCPSCGVMLEANKGKFEAQGSGFLRDETGRQEAFTRGKDSNIIDVDAIDVDD